MIRKALLSFAALILCIEGGAYCSRVRAQSPQTQPMVQAADLVYEGVAAIAVGPALWKSLRRNQ